MTMFEISVLFLLCFIGIIHIQIFKFIYSIYTVVIPHHMKLMFRQLDTLDTLRIQDYSYYELENEQYKKIMRYKNIIKKDEEEDYEEEQPKPE